jgi:hypothetical protein
VPNTQKHVGHRQHLAIGILQAIHVRGRPEAHLR